MARIEAGEELWDDGDLTVKPDKLERCWSDYQQREVNLQQLLGREIIQPEGHHD